MYAAVSDAAAIAGALAVFGVLVGFLGWVALQLIELKGEAVELKTSQHRIEGKVDVQSNEHAQVRGELRAHMDDEIRIREHEQVEDRHEREVRQAIIDGQFATLRTELADGLRGVHERIDQMLVERRRA